MQIQISHVRRRDTHRLILSKYSKGNESVLTGISNNDAHLSDIFELDSATNDRLLAENQLLPGIGVQELVFGFPLASIVIASFTHAHPLGGRFNGPDRGAWYAGYELRTSQTEVAFHKSLELAEIDRFVDKVTYDDYQADFNCEFHDLRNVPVAIDCLNPTSYIASQTLADELLNAGSQGIVYPSVRRAGGTCICCFRPVQVSNVRKGPRYQFMWDGSPDPIISRL